MHDFEYLAPVGLKEAALLLKKYGPRAVVKAGGVDLIDLMKEGIVSPPALLNILPLEELRGIKADPAEGLTIGALATLAEVAAHPAIVKSYPILAKAVGEAATPQIRNVATIGGNLCQRPHCWYFRSSDFNCLKKGGDTCFAVAGDNRYHAVIGEGPCHIVSASSAGLALVALGGGIETFDHEGGRVLTAEQFFTMPDVDMTRETVIKPGEIITKVRVLPQPPGSLSAFVTVRERESFDRPIAAAAVILVKEKNGIVRSARIVLGAAAPIPWRALAAEKILAGRVADDKAAARAAEAALEGAKPMSMNGYKIGLLREVVKRAILQAS